MESQNDHLRPESVACPEFPPYRPPSEADSVLVRVTRGCRWNRCSFCGMYKDREYEVRPTADVKRDIEAWGKIHPRARSVFLADADNLKHPDLVEIVREVKRVFPDAERVTSYVRLTTLWRRSLPELVALREAGLTRLHAGLESGSERVLKRVRKALKPDLAIEGGHKAMEAGFELSIYILCGLGGEDDYEEHGRASGRVVAAIWPHFLRLRSLMLFSGTPLREECDRGEFQPTSPLTRLHEGRAMIEELRWSPHDDEASPPHDLHVRSDHFSNVVWADRRQVFSGIDGELPADHESLLATIDRAIEAVQAGQRITDPGELALRGRL